MIKQYKVYQQQERQSQKIIGIRPLMEAIRSGKDIDKIFVQKGLKGELFHELKALMNEFHLSCQLVPVEKLNRISRANHQGVIAFLSAVIFSNLENVVAETFEKGEVPRFLLLDSITDVRNFGAICRTAECMGFHCAIVPEKGAAQINEEAVKTSSGALHYLPLCRVKSIPHTISYLQQSGLIIIACSEKGSQPIQSADLTKPTCIVLGSEESGISSEVLRKADTIVKIPMWGKTSSLNVSVAAGMIMYELNRQRNGVSY